MKKKNSKWDLIWIIPYIIGGVVIAISGVYYLIKVAMYYIYNLMLFAFHLGLTLLVINFGFELIGKAIDELREALHKQ